MCKNTVFLLKINLILPHDEMPESILFVCLFFVSMSAYHNQRLKEEKKANLERRRHRLRVMLQEERDQLEAELRDIVPDRAALKSQLVQKTEELRLAKEERRKKVAALKKKI